MIKNFRRKLNVLLVLLFLFTIVSITANTQKVNAATKKIQEIVIDLNSDKKHDKVVLNINMDGTLNLKINQSSYKIRPEMEDPYVFITIVDIDKKDKFKEIEFSEELDDGYSSKLIFTYDGKTIKKVFEHEGHIAYNGSGTITLEQVEQLLFTWNSYEKYKYNGKQFMHIITKYHPLSEEAVIKLPIVLQKTPTDKKQSFLAKRGDKVTIVLADKKGWFKLVNSKGQSGWLYCDEKNVIQGKNSYDIFSDLFQAG